MKKDIEYIFKYNTQNVDIVYNGQYSNYYDINRKITIYKNSYNNNPSFYSFSDFNTVGPKLDIRTLLDMVKYVIMP